MRILIADDDPTNLKLLRAVLEGEGHTVVEARDGVEALAALEKEPVGAIISDILMPNMDGYRLCYEVRRSDSYKDLPFITYTATYTSPADEKLCLDLGADKYLRKPASPSDLITALNEAVGGERRRPTIALDHHEVLKEYSERLVDKLEQKNVELAVATKSLLLQSAALEAAANAIFITDDKGVIEWVNPAFSVLTGYTAAEALGNTPRLLKSGEHSTHFYEEFWRTIKDGRTFRGEFTNRRKRGQLYYADHTVTPVRGVGGSISHFIGIMNDVSDRKRTDAELGRLADRLTATLDSITDGFLTIDTQWRFTFLNHEAERMLKRTNAELAGVEIWTAFPDVVGSTFELQYRRAMADKQTVTFEEFFAPLDIWVGVRAYPSEQGLAIYFRDITASKRTEDELRSTHAQLHQLLAHSPVVIYTLKITGDSVSPAVVSDNMERLLGIPAKEATYDWWSSSIHPDDKERVLATLASGLKKGGYKMEYRILHKNARYLWVEDNNRVLYDSKNQPIEAVGVWTDITEHKALQAQLLQSQKMESLGSLAGGIAHDFNNLLTGMMGYAELAQMKLPSDSPIQADLEEVRRSAERAATLTRQLLTFARKEIAEPQIINLSDLVSGLESLIRQLLGVDIDLIILTRPDLGRVQLDPAQFEQVLVNLAVNARDAMPSGGKLIINTHNTVVDEVQRTQGGTLEPGTYALVSVTDTGMGMSREIQSQAFDPFFTTKEKGKGTGLGLSTCYGIVTNNGGHIWVYSEVNVGTTFRIYFPIADALATVLQSDEPPVAASRGETVLFVDDEDTIRSFAVKALNGCGYKVLEASNGRAALKLVAEHKGPIDLLVTDMIMPGMTGRELSEVFNAVRPDIRVLFISGYTDDAILHQDALTRSFAFLQKPFSVSQLTRKVREVLDDPLDTPPPVDNYEALKQAHTQGENA